jgi:DNA-binding response OmpR family regulator
MTMKKALIIENNREVRENTAELLELRGFYVFQAPEGRSGFELARRHTPDVILCDMMMPESAGTQFLKLAKNDAAVAHVPLVFFSAGSPYEDYKKGAPVASGCYLKKPFSGEQLLDKVCLVMVKEG